MGARRPGGAARERRQPPPRHLRRSCPLTHLHCRLCSSSVAAGAEWLAKEEPAIALNHATHRHRGEGSGLGSGPRAGGSIGIDGEDGVKRTIVPTHVSPPAVVGAIARVSLEVASGGLAPTADLPRSLRRMLSPSLHNLLSLLSLPAAPRSLSDLLSLLPGMAAAFPSAAAELARSLPRLAPICRSLLRSAPPFTLRPAAAPPPHSRAAPPTRLATVRSPRKKERRERREREKQEYVGPTFFSILTYMWAP